MSDFTFYFGATNGQTKGALKRLEEPNVMINYASYSGEIWDSVEDLFVDSGGYSFIKGMGEYQTSHEDYLNWIEKTEPKAFALRDYPCEPDLLAEHDRTVREHQTMTTEAHRELLNKWDDMSVDSRPVSVVQGREINEYLTHLDELRDAGCLTDYVGIGSVCGRHAVTEIKPIVNAISNELADDVDIHGFGMKIPSLEQRDVFENLTSTDSMAYSYKARTDSRGRGIMCGYRQHALHYLEMRRDILSIIENHDLNDQHALNEY